VIYDGTPWFKNFGDLHKDVKPKYAPGEVASAVFWSGHPKNDLRTQGTFLEIQRKIGSTWKVVASDNDWDTVFKWDRVDGIFGHSRVTVEWTTSRDTPTGEYRIVHYGEHKKLSGRIASYIGYSSSFELRSRSGGGGSNDDEDYPTKSIPIK